MSTLEDLFGPPISVYTREQAIDDGILVDARAGAFADMTRQHRVSRAPGGVFMTASLFGLIERAVKAPRWLNDFRGVWHDVLTMADWYRAPLRAVDRGRATFRVKITGTGRRSLHTLAVAWDGEAFTFMLPKED